MSIKTAAQKILGIPIEDKTLAQPFSLAGLFKTVGEKFFPPLVPSAELQDYAQSLVQQLKDLGFKEGKEQIGTPDNQIQIFMDPGNKAKIKYVALLGQTVKKSDNNYAGATMTVWLDEKSKDAPLSLFRQRGYNVHEIEPGFFSSFDTDDSLYMPPGIMWQDRAKLEEKMAHWILEKATPDMADKLKVLAGMPQVSAKPSAPSL